MKNCHPTSHRCNSGFTLIELLVVIAIIAILAAMLLPAIGIAKRKAAEASARADMQNIGMAISKYESDYNGRFPAPGVQTGASDVTYGYTGGGSIAGVTAIATNSGVVAILMDVEKFNNGVATANLGHVLNPRRVANLNPKITSDSSDHGVGPDGEYRDPWGHPYIISMDTSLDGQCRDQFYARKNVSQDNVSGSKGLNGLSNPNSNGNPDEFEFAGKYMVWSLGADGKADLASNPKPPPFGSAKSGLNKDNLLSWQ